MMRFLLCALSVACVLTAAGISHEDLYGFTARSAHIQREIERKFLALPSPEKARDVHAFLTAEPHVAGSPRDRALAEWIRDRWRDDGLERVEITQHDVLLPYATDISVEMTAPSPWRASLKEEAVAGDPFTARDVGIPYHAYSASGDITAAVVYAGGGNPADYDWLAERGIDVRGKIVLVRYSVPYSYRGFKAYAAEQRGAAGILIYSDPADDGAQKGKTYPNGPWGPESHIQRGGIVYDFLVPGDPLTPGWPSLPGARRISASDAVSLPRIMSVPLSWKDARPILQALKGPEARAAWQGGSQFTYRVGAGPATVRMRVRMDDRVRPIWTVTSRITGTAHPEQLVLVGNHRDAWVYGGVDPSSGTASMMELARAFGELARKGVKPARTIVFASWDAEEFALTSSTEWGEEHERDLAAHAVAYLNVDSAVSGPNFSAAAVPTLNRVVQEAVASVNDPVTARPLAITTLSNRLGSGSDYTVFLNFVGIPIVDMSFTGPYGVYHSVYDDHIWMLRYGDSGFRYHATIACVWGLMALRLANADIVPLDNVAYAERIREFLDEIVNRARPQEREALVPARQAIERFAAAARAIERRRDRTLAASVWDQPRADAITHALMQAERALTDRHGIPGRPWYRHLIYAPKFTYAPEVLPGISEAIDGSRAHLAVEVGRLSAALNRAAAVLKMAPRPPAPARERSEKD